MPPKRQFDFVQKEVICTSLTKEKDMILDYKESKTPIHPEIKVITNTDYKSCIVNRSYQKEPFDPRR
jgi:hypothetical protein